MAATSRSAVRTAARVARHPLWSEILAPVTRSTGWYVAARWRGSVLPAQHSIPNPAPTIALAAQAAIDELVLAVVRIGRRPRPPEEMARVEAEVAEALALYRERGWLDDPAAYHLTPPPPERVRVRPARSGSVGYEVVSFESGYEPHAGEPGRERWLSDFENKIVYAWVLRHAEPRPWLVCVHGAGMGQASGDLRVFRAAWLHHALGLNVAMPIQARHGPRRAGLPFGVGFPGDDLLDSVHAVAQSAWDIRRLIAWIRAQEDEPVGVQGLSLGGYTTALLAGLEDDLACVIAGVPAVDFADLMERHAPLRFRTQPGYERLAELARDVHHVVSPLALALRVPLDRRFIYAGLADRLVHPIRQVHALWTHWDRPQITWFSGSHIGFFLSRPVAELIEHALRASGMVARDHPAADGRASDDGRGAAR